MRAIALLLLVLAVGCGGKRSRTAADLDEAQIAAAVYMSPKAILYTETIQKAFKTKIRKQQAVFEGLWDVDRELTGSFAMDVAEVGYTAKPLTHYIGGDRFAAFQSAAEYASFLQDKPGVLSLDRGTEEILVRAGVSYVLLLRCFNVMVGSNPAVYFTRAGVHADLILYDLGSHAEVFRERVTFGKGYAHNGNPRVLEHNRLYLLRKKTKEWISTFVHRRLREELRWR